MSAVATWLGNFLIALISGPLESMFNAWLKNHNLTQQVQATTASNNVIIQQVTQLQADVNKLKDGNTQAMENDLKALATADNSGA